MINNHCPETIWLIDTTLRDGEQSPGVAFSRKTRETVATLLAEAGVDELEAGTPAMGPGEQADILAISRLNLSCRLTCLCRARREDIEDAASCRTEGVHIAFPVSSIQLGAMNKNEDWVLLQLEDLLAFAIREFPFVSVGALDATRADPVFLKQFTRQAFQHGAHRLRIADTVGIATPASISAIVALLQESAETMALEFHAHNDLGMATANAISAIQAGINAVSVTVNGLGERAGNAALEEVATAVAVTKIRTSNICLERLMPLCQYIAEASCRPIPLNKAVTGSLVFTHESGIHCNGMLKDVRTFEPFSGSLLGRSSELLIGKHSGKAMLRQVLKDMNIDFSHPVDDELCDQILCNLRALYSSADIS